tara:strand:- start:45 stop:449 length:405 start_codon:yes stop_codon:yes gene_type:complete
MSLIAEIKAHEGYSSTVYKDTLGKDTIGYGFLIKGLELDEDICDLILKRKLERNKRILQKKLTWFDSKPKEVQRILQNMFYQLHFKLFQFKKTLSYIEKGDYNNASYEMLDSLWAKQTPNRASELSCRMGKVNE